MDSDKRNRKISERYKLQEKISNELHKNGILNTQFFTFPSCVNETNPEIDFFINSPMRAILEFYVSNFDHDMPPKIKEGVKKELIESMSSFNPPAPVFVITNLKDTNWLKDLEVNLIELKKDQKDPHKWCVKKIKEMMLKNSFITPSSFTPNNIIDGEFSDILISLNAILPRDNFEMITNEINILQKEINSAHYTCAALRVGRTIEFTLYACANSWNINVNNVTTQKLEVFDKNYEMFKSALIENSYDEANTQDSKQKLISAIKKLNNNLQDLSFEIDTKESPIDSDAPVNIQTLLRDIKKKYIKSDHIRSEIDLIIKENYLNRIVKIRNAAAHARTSLENKEIDKSEIDEMVDNLRSFLFRLVNVATLILHSKN